MVKKQENGKTMHEENISRYKNHHKDYIENMKLHIKQLQ
jgi:hypothetical protein